MEWRSLSKTLVKCSLGAFKIDPSLLAEAVVTVFNLRVLPPRLLGGNMEVFPFLHMESIMRPWWFYLWNILWQSQFCLLARPISFLLSDLSSTTLSRLHQIRWGLSFDNQNMGRSYLLVPPGLALNLLQDPESYVFLSCWPSVEN